MLVYFTYEGVCFVFNMAASKVMVLCRDVGKQLYNWLTLSTSVASFCCFFVYTTYVYSVPLSQLITMARAVDCAGLAQLPSHPSHMLACFWQRARPLLALWHIHILTGTVSIYQRCLVVH